MNTWLKNHVWDVLCCLILSVSLSFISFAGYEIKDPKASSLLIVVIVCAVCTVLLFAAGYNRVTMLIGIAVAVILIVAAVITARSFHAENGGRIDKNPALFWMITIGSTAVCYLLSRWRIGLIVLLVGGSVLSAAFGFLKYPIRVPVFLIFMFTLILLYLYRVYHVSLLASYTGNVRFTRYMMQSAAFVLVIVMAAGSIYAGVIRPIDPPTHPLKLITKLQSLEILQQVGVSRRTEVQNPDQSTEIENDETKMTNRKKDRNDKQSPQEKKDQEKQGDLQQRTEREKGQAVNYHQDRTWFYVMITILIVLLSAVPFVIRRLLHRRWENRVLSAGPTEGSVMIYRYLLKKLRYAGFTRPPEVTLYNYMKGQRRAMRGFAVGSTDLFVLTDLYQKVLYGCRELEKTEFTRFWKVYTAFRGNMKKKLGKAKYALRFFLI